MNAKNKKTIEELKDDVRLLENKPGVYRYYDVNNNLLYVGKAKDLKKRVSSYFGNRKVTNERSNWLVNNIHRIEVTYTPTENDALILEHDQITSLNPKFNILFRDDKTYPYLKISQHKAPRILSYRGKPTDDCYGPFPSAWSVKKSIQVLQKMFQLRTCTDTNYASRKRPCLLHQIGKCSAPCVNKISLEKYNEDVNIARRFITGEDDYVSKNLVNKMETAAANEDFEEAAKYRDGIKALAEIRQVSAITGGYSNADYVALYNGADGVCVRLAAIRGSFLVSELDFFPQNAEKLSDNDILLAFIAQHYSRHIAPERIILRSSTSNHILQEIIKSKKTKFITRPSKKENEKLKMVYDNAKASLIQKLKSNTSHNEAFIRLASFLNLKLLTKADCFDISHSMGEAAQASCVVCVAGQMEKSLYRRFNLRNTPKADDYAGMREVLKRRYKTYHKDNSILPDLIIIDGGIGQISASIDALKELGIDKYNLLGVAKGASRKPGLETLIMANGEIIEIPPTDLAFRIIQRMRDEAHRFAISGHRKRRDKKRRGSVLEDIEGIGPSIRRKLINEFGGLQGLKKVSVTDLSRINGVGPELALRIYRVLHA